MSYDVSLTVKEVPVCVDHFTEGGIHPIGGSAAAELNITYNYSPLYHEVFGKDGLRWLDGKTASHSEETLELGVLVLGSVTYTDYWAPTKGNAGYALGILLKWAQKNPDAVWSVS